MIDNHSTSARSTYSRTVFIAFTAIALSSVRVIGNSLRLGRSAID